METWEVHFANLLKKCNLESSTVTVIQELVHNESLQAAISASEISKAFKRLSLDKTTGMDLYPFLPSFLIPCIAISIFHVIFHWGTYMYSKTKWNQKKKMYSRSQWVSLIVLGFKSLVWECMPAIKQLVQSQLGWIGVVWWKSHCRLWACSTRTQGSGTVRARDGNWQHGLLAAAMAYLCSLE